MAGGPRRTGSLCMATPFSHGALQQCMAIRFAWCRAAVYGDWFRMVLAGAAAYGESLRMAIASCWQRG